MPTVTQPSLIEVKKTLQQLLPKLREKYQISSLGIFGSFVRNENSEKSDLDLMVSYEKLPSLLRFVELKLELSETLQLPVDLVIQDDLKPHVWSSAKKDVIYL